MTLPRGTVVGVRDAVRRRADLTLAVGWVAVAVSLILIPISVWLTLSGPADPSLPNYGLSVVDQVLNHAFGLTFGPVGLLIAARQRENVIAWILIWLGLSMSIAGAAGNFKLITADPGAAAMVATIGDASWVAIIGLLWALVLLYPDGHLTSRRWRPLGRAVLAWLALFGFPVAVWEVVSPTTIHGGAQVPSGALSTLAQLSLGAALVLFVPLALGIGAAVVARWRRSTGVERQQLEVFGYASSVMVLSWIPIVAGLPGPWLALHDLALLALPVAIAVAILRYRLYEIDVVIERTLVYGTTTAAIGAAFFSGIVVLQSVLRPITGGSELAVAASTLLCFALFQPIRRRMQSTVDQRFYRSRYDAALTLDAFTSRLAGEVDLDAVGAELADAVAVTMRPSHVSIWLRERA
jgi:uncharacterized membrane protein YhaH (DUF805 family)